MEVCIILRTVTEVLRTFMHAGTKWRISSLSLDIFAKFSLHSVQELGDGCIVLWSGTGGYVDQQSGDHDSIVCALRCVSKSRRFRANTQCWAVPRIYLKAISNNVAADYTSIHG